MKTHLPSPPAPRPSQDHPGSPWSSALDSTWCQKRWSAVGPNPWRVLSDPMPPSSQRSPGSWPNTLSTSAGPCFDLSLPPAPARKTNLSGVSSQAKHAEMGCQDSPPHKAQPHGAPLLTWWSSPSRPPETRWHVKKWVNLINRLLYWYTALQQQNMMN